MKPGFRWIGALLLMTAGGCAGLLPGQRDGAEARARLERGLTAMEAERYRESYDELAWVYTRCPGREAGTRALAALAALELDPRNPAARPALGAELLGRLIRDPGLPSWMRPLAETSFLTALALGAPDPRGAAPVRTVADTAATRDSAAVEAVRPPRRPASVLPEPPEDGDAARGCGRKVAVEGWSAPPLPRLPGPSMASMLTDAQLERDTLALRADSLDQELAGALEELTAVREELERIRRTLKP